MANKKFSEFVLKTSTSDVSHIVGYNGAENVQITPANFVTGGGTGVFLPLAGGTMVGNTIHNDNVKSIYGNPGNDLEIYHDGNNSKITESGSGGLYIGSSVLGIQNSTHSETMAIFTPNSSVELYYDNSKKFETTSTGISVTENIIVGDSHFIGDDSFDNLVIQAGGTGNLENLVLSSSNDSIFYTGGTTPSALGSERLRIYDSDGRAEFAGNVSVPASKYLEAIHTDNTYARLKGNGLFFNRSNVFIAAETDNFATLNIGYSSVRWGNVEINAAATKFLNGSLERMRLDSSGNLGIGTSSASVGLQLGNSASGETKTAIFNSEGGGEVGLTIKSRTNRAKILVADNDSNAYVVAESQKAFFGTSANGDTTNIVVDSSGNLGVGTSSPDAKMQIEAAINSTAPSTDSNNLLLIENTNATGSCNIRLKGGDGATRIMFGKNSTPNDKLFITPRANETNHIVVDGSGNLGVGNSSPQNLLHLGDNANAVAGTIRIDSFVASQFWKLEPGTNTLNVKDYNGTSILSFNGETDASIFSGNVGVGTSTPSDFNSKGRNLVVNSDGDTGITISANTSSSSTLLFADAFAGTGGTATYRGSVEYDHAIDSMLFSTAATEKMRLDSSGNLLVGTTSTLGGATDDFVTVANVDGARGGIRIGNTGGSGNTSCMRFHNSNGVVGGIRTSGSATAYDTSSDYRLKEDLQDFEGLDLVSKIPVYNYKWKADKSRSYGVLAHQLQEVLPQAVTGDKDAEEMQAVDYSKIVPLLVKSIQELSAKLEALECQCEKK